MGIAERKQREKEQKRNLIIDSAEKLFFSKGFTGASMDDIAKEAEYSKGTIYLYFKSKDEILAAIHLRGMNLMYKMFRDYASKEKCGLDKLYKIGNANFDFMNKYPDYYSTMKLFDNTELNLESVQEQMFLISQISQNIIGFMVESVIQGQMDGSVNKNLDPLKTAHILAGSSSGMFQWINKLRNEGFSGDLNPDELFEEYFNVMHLALKA